MGISMDLINGALDRVYILREQAVLFTFMAFCFDVNSNEAVNHLVILVFNVSPTHSIRIW